MHSKELNKKSKKSSGLGISNIFSGIGSMFKRKEKKSKLESPKNSAPSINYMMASSPMKSSSIMKS